MRYTLSDYTLLKGIVAHAHASTTAFRNGLATASSKNLTLVTKVLSGYVALPLGSYRYRMLFPQRVRRKPQAQYR
jgi:hypothetical protein